MARLDALFFTLYGLDGDDGGYVVELFPSEQHQKALRALGLP
jgi:hypothetical protein